MTRAGAVSYRAKRSCDNPALHAQLLDPIMILNRPLVEK